MTTNDIDAIRPATDLLIAQMRETLGEIQAHEHPTRGEDFYCLNLVSWLGERMGPVLRRLADEQSETFKWRQKHTALADEFTAEATRLQAELAETRAALDHANRELAGTRADRDSAVKANTAWANQVDAKDVDGPWKALIVHEGYTEDDFSELNPDDEVDIVIVRDTALPDDEGRMPGTYKSADVAFKTEDIYVDGDGGTDGPTMFARAQAMSAGLNAAEVA
ncbi:hypothetical protein OG989_04245 [Micromonospora sp. NBC_01740]|uniref:hypothetical protein n=1 Tax=Micromonospora sp. NBC_01740 TaxID=2975986 RepID=UPI002E1236E5|nr:hypothetical protein OG989_04245 [Micromonospora sp. NBC_01740]